MGNFSQFGEDIPTLKRFIRDFGPVLQKGVEPFVGQGVLHQQLDHLEGNGANIGADQRRLNRLQVFLDPVLL